MTEILRPPEWNGIRHPDQTSKQPIVWLCPNPDCRPTGPCPSGEVNFYNFESEYPRCPKCGSGPPSVQKKVLIHFLMPDRNGNIEGINGLHYFLACDRKRKEVATFTNGEAGTGSIQSVNCPGCRKVIKRKRLQTHGAPPS